GKRNGQLRHQRPPDALAFSDSKRAIEPCGIISSPCVDAPRASQLAFDDRRSLMKIHEYQAKAILSRYGVPVPRGEVAFNATEAGEIAHRLGGSVVVVKAQIHAGGRGKGGGVKLARSPEEAERLAAAMIGMTLVTHQTGPEGRVVSRVLVEEGLQMTSELYLSIVLDRSSGKPVMMPSPAARMPS